MTSQEDNMTLTPTKQRVEVDKATLRTVPTLAAADPGTAVVDQKAGAVTWWDHAKEYYHAIFAAITGVLVSVLTIAPALDPAMALLPPNWRNGIGIALLVANGVVTRFKSNQTWVPGPLVEPATPPPTSPTG